MFNQNELFALSALPDLEQLRLISSSVELMAPEEVWRSVAFCISAITNTIWAIDAEDMIPDDRIPAH